MEKLKLYAKHNLNVMLIGHTGIGKTTITKNIADELGLKFKYYSTSTLDPFADLVGIPAPNKETQTLDFYKPQDLQDAEFIMFDELNRAPIRVLNAVLEIIQFKTVNGSPLKNLKMIWAAINPPNDDYTVEELDPALIDRFHVYVKMKPEINLEYMTTKMNTEVAKTLKYWWDEILDVQQKQILTPRRLEYLGFMVSNDIPWRDSIPTGHTFPVEDLSRRLKKLKNQNPDASDDLAINKITLLEHTDIFLKKIDTEPSLAIPVSNIMKKFNINDLFKCRDLLENLPKELLVPIAKLRFIQQKRLFQELFKENNVDLVNYPKITEIFEFKL
jgi:hypothetical protein